MARGLLADLLSGSLVTWASVMSQLSGYKEQKWCHILSLSIHLTTRLLSNLPEPRIVRHSYISLYSSRLTPTSNRRRLLRSHPLINMLFTKTLLQLAALMAFAGGVVAQCENQDGANGTVGAANQGGQAGGAGAGASTSCAAGNGGSGGMGGPGSAPGGSGGSGKFAVLEFRASS